MKKNSVILFDIDYTLFDTEIFREKLYDSISLALGIEKDKLTDKQQDAIRSIRSEVGYFHPEKFSHYLALSLNREKDEDKILKAIFKPENFLKVYYRETESVLKSLSGKLPLGVFSKGYSSLQKEKIKKLKKFLEDKHIHISTNKFESLPEILNKYKDKTLYIVDDALDVLHNAKQLSSSVITIWIKRGFFAEKQQPIEGFAPDAIIENLSELLPIVLG